MAAGAKAVALHDHKRMLDDHARRVRDSHRIQMQKLGLKPEDMAEDDDMGDVFVCGDITTTNQAPSPGDGKQSSTTTKILPYVLAAALAGGGAAAGLPALVSALRQPPDQPPVATQPGVDTDTQYELRISSGE